MFRLEIDALNAIYKEMKKTNELLERLLEQKETVQEPIIDKPKRPYTRRNKDAV